MAENVLGSLFQDIADAIRSKTGGTDKMAPSDFPDEILSIVAGGSVEGDDGTAVRATTGWIYTDQSGIYRQTITHGLGVVPDLVLVSNGNWLGLTNAQKEANPLMFVWGAHSKFKTAFSGTLCGAACTIQGITLSNGNDKGIDEYSPTDVFISCPDNNTFEFGMSESSYNGYYGLVAPDDEGTEGVYKWIAITGMGGTVSDGGGSAEGCVTVTFMNGDTVLFARPVYVGDDCPDPIAQGHIKETPTKESTAQYEYTFNGWATADGGTADSTALQNVTENKVLYATFASEVRYYTIRFFDGDTLLNTEQVAYGGSSTFEYAKRDHNFVGWTPEPTYITGNMDCYGAWVESSEIADSWEQIIAAVNAGTHTQKYSVGMYKLLDLGEHGIIKMQLVGFGVDDTTKKATEYERGSGNIATTWVAKDLTTTQAMYMPKTSSKQVSNFAADNCVFREYLLTSILPSMPAILQSALKTPYKDVFYIPYSGSSGSHASANAKVWPPSRAELGFGVSGKDSGYNHDYSEFYSTQTDRIKYINGTETAAQWWLRDSSLYGEAGCVFQTGGVSTAPAHGGVERYACIGFCI